MFNQIGGEEGKKKTEQERDGGEVQIDRHILGVFLPLRNLSLTSKFNNSLK